MNDTFPTLAVFHAEGTKLGVTITSHQRSDISYRSSWKLNAMANSRREDVTLETQNKGMMEES